MVFILISLVCLPGCWNYREINEMNIVAGMAVDLNKNNDYVVTVEIIQAENKGGEPQMVSVVIGMEGRTIFEGVRNIIMRSGRRLYWAHAKVLIISEEVARQGIIGILDWVTREREVRSDIALLVSREKTAGEIFRSRPQFETTVSYQLSNTLDDEQHVGKVVNMPLWRFLQHLGMEGRSSIVSTVNTLEYNEQIVSQVYGAALFLGEKQIGWLNGEDVKVISWLISPNIKTLLMSIYQQGVEVTYEFLDNNVAMKPFKKDGSLAIRIDQKVKVQLVELSSPVLHYNDLAVLRRMEHVLESQMERRIRDEIRELQKQYQIDILGLSGVIKRDMPEVWRQIKNDWLNIYPNLPVEVHVDVKIVETQMSRKPISVEE